MDLYPWSNERFNCYLFHHPWANLFHRKLDLLKFLFHISQLWPFCRAAGNNKENLGQTLFKGFFYSFLRGDHCKKHLALNFPNPNSCERAAAVCHLVRKRGEAGAKSIVMLISPSSFNSTKKRFAFHFSHRYTENCSISSQIYWKITAFPSVSSKYNGKSWERYYLQMVFLVVVQKVLGKWSWRGMNLHIFGFISNI